MLVLLWLACAQAAPPAGPLTLDAAERAALERSPDLRGDLAQVEGAEDDARSQRGLLLPKLNAQAQLQYWGSPYQVSFLSPAAVANIPPAFSSFAAPLTVRNSWTSTETLTLTEPLTPLWGTWSHLEALRLARAAAVAHLSAAGRDLVFQVRQAYFRLLQAQGNADVSKESVGELESHAKVAAEQFEAGTLVKADLLRAQVQLGQARQDLVHAQALVKDAAGALNRLLGRRAGEAVSVEDPFEGALPEAQGTLEELTAKALGSRPDLEELSLRRAQADKEVTAAWSQLVPAIALTGQYQHATGQLFLPADQAFVGASLNWDVWDWGRDYYAVKSAQARASQGQASLEAARLRLEAEVQEAFDTLGSDRDALKVAAEVVEQAQEGFRLETQRYEAQTATSTDLLDAQASLSQSKYRRSNARYDYLTALAQLEALVGEPLLGR
ncbi:MAG: TolC family protein [Deltaproteobacteria bacterium]